MTVHQRFQKYVRRTLDPCSCSPQAVKHTCQCWLWQGYATKDGYGSFNTGVKNDRGKFILEGAHRVAYMHAHKLTSIPDGLHVMHSCDVKLCVRPEHLSLGTREDNLQDARRKGRLNPPARTGEKRARVTEEIVRELRRLWATNLYSLTNLQSYSQSFVAGGLDIKTIANIVNRKSWRSVE